jgi:chromosome partitioning protein
MEVISIVNQKGGVGKTTTAVALASFLHHRGLKVLAIDLDSQMNATSWLLGRHLTSAEASVYDSLSTKKRDDISGPDDWPLAELIETSELGFDYVPASRDLSAADAEFANDHFLLRDRLDELEGSQDGSDRPYDFCLVDCPPSLGTLVYVALTASDGMIVPIQADQFSIDGVGQLIRTARKVKRYNPDLDVLGLLLSNLDLRFGETKAAIEQLEQEYGDRLFETHIPTRARIREGTRGKDLREHARGTDVIDIYESLVDEVLERTGHPAHQPA